MRNKYEILLEINLDHEYYNDGSFPGLELIPHPKSALFFRNYKLLFKRQSNRYFVLQEGLMDGDQWSPIVEIAEEKALVFLFKCNDDLFQMKTDCAFFANKNNKILIEFSEEDSEMTLLPFKKGPVKLDNSIGKERALFNLNINNLDQLTEIVVEPGEMKEVVPDQSGRVKISKDKSQSELFLWNEFDDQYDGIICLNLLSKIGRQCAFKFKAREISWEYNIRFKYLNLRTERDQFHLKEENGDIQFELDVIDDKFIFSSTTAIKLQRNQDYSMYIEIDGEKEFVNIGSPSIKNIGKSSKLVDKLVLVDYVTV